jgi:hypothetical protein
VCRCRPRGIPHGDKERGSKKKAIDRHRFAGPRIVRPNIARTGNTWMGFEFRDRASPSSAHKDISGEYFWRIF